MKKKIFYEDPVLVTDLKQLDTLEKECNPYKQRITFTCSNCRTSVGIQLRKASDRRLLCSACKKKQTNLEKYGVENPSQCKEVQNKIKSTNLKKYGHESHFLNENVKAKIQNTILEKYGCTNPNQNKDIKDKKKKVFLEKYGVENPFQNKDIKEKIKQVNVERYGVEHPAQNRDILLKIQNTNLKKYGCTSPFNNEEVRDKIQKTLIGKYGVSNPSKSKEILSKKKKTNLKKYGVENPSQIDSVQNKIKQTNFDKYGCERPLQNKDVLDKAKKTTLERYGETCYLKSASFHDVLKSKYGMEHPPTYKFTYKSETFDSSWELIFYIYFKEHGFNIVRHKASIPYTYENKTHQYFPDFEIDGQLFEIKGDQFFKDGRMVNPFDHSQDGLFEAKHQCMISHGVKILSSIDMIPYINWIEKNFSPSYIQSFKK